MSVLNKVAHYQRKIERSKENPEGPKLLSADAKLEPLNMEVDIASTLPKISPNYRSLPEVSPPIKYKKARLSKETQAYNQAVAEAISLKQQRMRTTVYSGVKARGPIPSLYDLCVYVLKDNIDALEHTGEVPYDILKPILQHATPDQQLQLEFYNKYLVADTDELWEFHCCKDFPTGQRLSDETAREMYLRCTEEREGKLKALNSNIQQAFANSTPVRQTKLAYVDDVAKPPRNVARQQAKYGTGTTSESVAKSGKGTSGPKPSTSTSGASTSGSSHRATASDTTSMASSEEEEKEGQVVCLSAWLRKPNVKGFFTCREVEADGYLSHSSHLLVTDSHIYVLRTIPGQKDLARIVLRGPLYAVVKITSKKRHPELTILKVRHSRTGQSGDIGHGQRCTEEREGKLKALNSNIQQAFANSTPVRQTKLAYVDDVAKPPCNVARQQAKYGTATTSTSTSGSSTSGSSHRATASDTTSMASSEEEEKEGQVVCLSAWLRKPNVKGFFTCREVEADGYLSHSSHLLVTDSHIYVLRTIPGQKDLARIVLRGPLYAVVKITSKKRHPELTILKVRHSRTGQSGDIGHGQRCTEEREGKLKALNSNIQQAFANSTPVRQTKLAYVDDVAKPPCNVARQQAKYGTATTSTSTSGSSTSGSSHRATASALEHTGEVPYDILKPILQHATPDQQLQLEFYNKYLVADTDELWEFHCCKDFPTGQRLSDETAREMYLRCTEEREGKLKALNSNIQQAFANSTPVRQTKLAYVDDVAKPPRNVARQQAKYGTGTTSESVAKSGKGTSGPKPSTSTSGASTSGSSHRATASDTTSMASSEEEEKEGQVVCLSAWLRKPNVKGFFTCREVEADGYLSHISHLLVTDSHIYVLRTIPGQKDLARIVLRGPLYAVVKITSKKRHPELTILKVRHSRTGQSGDIGHGQRCTEEREGKLKALNSNIQQAFANSTPVRQTKLAYVDDVAKPPRNVARQQAKYGTATTSTSTSGASTSGSSHRATASALEHTGEVPYDILKPILQHATPDQQLQLEFYNKYLVADTDELWEFHCCKDFPTGQRLSDETAREMYLRCTEEREGKLKALNSNIQQAFANSTPVRQTKLAYVDDVAKPPRNVARQQAKYGTGTTSESVAKSGKGTSGPKPSTSTSGASTSGSSHRATASDTTSMASSEEEEKEGQVVCLSAWLRKPNVKGFFTCREVEADGYLSHISHLLVTDSHIYVLRTIPGQKDLARIVLRGPLYAVVKITSKKRHPELTILKVRHSRTGQSGDIGHGQDWDQIRTCGFLTLPERTCFTALSGSFNAPLPWALIYDIFGCWERFGHHLYREWRRYKLPSYGDNYEIPLSLHGKR